MELVKEREIKTSATTIGDFLVDGEWFSYGLEPADRGLRADMTEEQITATKVDGATAVPPGRYEVVKYFSPKHNRDVPRVRGIPGFDYVEIHVGNYAWDTTGCLLLGYEMAVDAVLQSADAIDTFYKKFFAAIDNGEQVWITYAE